MTDYTFKSNFTTKIDFRQAKTPKTNSLTVVYIHGLYSDCWGRKPENVMEWCAANGVNFFRFELAGHGSDSARYEETDVNIWKAQLLEVIDDIVKTDVILAGSSLGGWLSLLAALERPEKSKVCWDWLPHPILPQIWKLIFLRRNKRKNYTVRGVWSL